MTSHERIWLFLLLANSKHLSPFIYLFWSKSKYAFSSFLLPGEKPQIVWVLQGKPWVWTTMTDHFIHSVFVCFLIFVTMWKCITHLLITLSSATGILSCLPSFQYLEHYLAPNKWPVIRHWMNKTRQPLCTFLAVWSALELLAWDTDENVEPLWDLVQLAKLTS